jgi:hypothetical protein
MDATEETPSNSAFAALRRLARPRRDVERCDFCGVELGEDHQHLIQSQPLSQAGAPRGEAGRKELVCVCGACAILFGDQGETQYRRVPRRALFLADFRMTDAQWEGLLIPIQLAFFVYDSRAKKVVALYPSPGGLTESLLDLASWEEITRANPVVGQMTPDVEGLLVNRVRRGGAAPEYYLAPIDVCFKLAGLIRSTWRGLSGGEAVWKEIGQFFTHLKARSNQVSQNGPHRQGGREERTRPADQSEGQLGRKSHA